MLALDTKIIYENNENIFLNCIANTKIQYLIEELVNHSDKSITNKSNEIC